MKWNDLMTKEAAVQALADPQVFNQLSEENKKLAIETIRESETIDKGGGLMGRVIGMKPNNAAISVTLWLCVALIVIAACKHDETTWDRVFTLLATALGYIFGAAQNSNN